MILCKFTPHANPTSNIVTQCVAKLYAHFSFIHPNQADYVCLKLSYGVT